MSTALLEVRDLSIVFGGLKAVDSLSFAVQKGTIHALIGPNGAGKSTTFNCICKLYRPASGQVLLDGRNVTDLQPHQVARLGVARTFQNLELFGGLSVLDNVLMGAQARSRVGFAGLRGYDKETVAFARHLIHKAGLSEFESAKASDLDFGRQKLLELARASALKPRLLLLDEPAAGLRSDEIGRLDELLRTLVREQGMTVLLVEHVMKLVMGISDRITVLSFGKKLAEGTPQEIQSHPEVIRSYLGAEAGSSSEA